MSETWMDWIKYGNLEEYLSWLSSHPADIDAITAGGVPAVRFAMYYGRPDIAAILVEKGAKLDLFTAAAVGRLDVLQEQASSTPELIHCLSIDGYPALGMACFFNHAGCVEFLLDRGAQVNQPSDNPQHVMPIHAAVAARSLPITRMLLQHGADANAIQGGGFSPLHTAAQNGDLEIARLLLDHGADPTRVNEAGHTPIDLARDSHNENLVDLLSQRGS